MNIVYQSMGAFSGDDNRVALEQQCNALRWISQSIYRSYSIATQLLSPLNTPSVNMKWDLASCV